MPDGSDPQAANGPDHAAPVRRLPSVKPKRPVLGALVAFAAGALLGGCLVAFLSVSASGVFLLMAQLSLQAEEDRQAAQAWRKGDFGAALEHAACASAAMYGRGARAFDPERTTWSLGFPFVAPILRRIIELNLTLRGEAHVRVPKIV
jgi:hypothetical protein